VPSRSPVLPRVPDIPHAPERFLALPPQIEEEGFDQVRFLPDKISEKLVKNFGFDLVFREHIVGFCVANVVFFTPRLQPLSDKFKATIHDNVVFIVGKKKHVISLPVPARACCAGVGKIKTVLKTPAVLSD
jgi:hypothetical protein